MTKKPQRKLNRWDEYNYNNDGYYFITICAHKFLRYFGKISGEQMVLNQVGKIAAECWRQIPEHFPEIELDEFVIMPNHLHGIISIVGNRHQPDRLAGAYSESNTKNTRRQNQQIPIIIGSFKSVVSRSINKKFTDLNFHWQKSYYDHIVRSTGELGRIEWYIVNNPARWALDRNNPENLDAKVIEDDYVDTFLKHIDKNCL